MPEVTLNIPDNKFNRIVNILSRKGYVYNPESQATELEQQVSATKTLLIALLKDEVIRQEFAAFRESNTFNLNDVS